MHSVFPRWLSSWAMSCTSLARACLMDKAWVCLRISPSGVDPITSLTRSAPVIKAWVLVSRPAFFSVSRFSSTNRVFMEEI